MKATLLVDWAAYDKEGTVSRRFEGQVAVITGAARGMGRTSTLAFSEEGAAVAITDIRGDELDGVAAEIRAAGGNVVAVSGDVTDPGTIDRLVTEAKQKFGSINVLHNNAGMFFSAPLDEHTVEDFQRVLSVNCVAQFIAIKRVVPEMRLAGKGSIVNMASVMSFVSIATMPAYGASKAGVLGLTRAIASEVGPEIRCNAVCPGAVDTPMVDDSVRDLPEDERQAAREAFAANQILKRFAGPEEIIPLVLFLASDEASFMTGQCVNIDGGWTAT